MLSVSDPEALPVEFIPEAPEFMLSLVLWEVVPVEFMLPRVPLPVEFIVPLVPCDVPVLFMPLELVPVVAFWVLLLG